MNLDLSGKVALVTGSTQGIGLAIGQRLAAEGARVILNGRNHVRLAAAVAQVPGADGLAGDVTQPDLCRGLISELTSRHGRLDVLVCNVGSGASVPLGEEGPDEWRRMIDLNLLSAAHTVQAARALLAATRGTILCISSICGSAALGCPIGYAAAKAALNSYVRNMARPLGREGIRLNALAPGNILFPGSTWERRLAADAPGVALMLANEVALGRLGQAEEIADFAAFLVSPRSAFATGSIFVVDGGQLRA